ncbi:probable serine hydrolase [Diorhabda sublineata]|uniref:probable serine hydrolase n=1 Tax=Diorhabda sublineata TaxID=1163346 RepID=UPI0024E0DFD8|nr:probable serine hydrolase [Diorhabda sublineata]
MSANVNGSINGDFTEFKEVEIPVPWGYICGKWWGSRDLQPIIGIHGWQDNSGTFDKLAPYITQQGLSFLCIDLPGHGFSSHIPKGLQYNLWYDGVYYVRRIVKHFDWKKITIIGHSLGGGIAFLYASIFPDEVSKYVSIDISSPSVRNPKRILEFAGIHIDKLFEYEKKTLAHTPCYSYENMLDMMLDAHDGSVDKEGCEILLKRGTKPCPDKENLYVFTRDPRLKIAVLSFLSMDKVLYFASRITCEVLNIRAEDGIKLDPPANYDLPLDTIECTAKRLERVVVKGTHHVHLTNAKAVAPIIINFLLSDAD